MYEYLLANPPVSDAEQYVLGFLMLAGFAFVYWLLFKA